MNVNIPGSRNGHDLATDSGTELGGGHRWIAAARAGSTGSMIAQTTVCIRFVYNRGVVDPGAGGQREHGPGPGGRYRASGYSACMVRMKQAPAGQRRKRPPQARLTVHAGCR